MFIDVSVLSRPAWLYKSSRTTVPGPKVQASVSCPVIGIGAGGKVAGQAVKDGFEAFKSCRC